MELKIVKKEQEEQEQEYSLDYNNNNIKEQIKEEEIKEKEKEEEERNKKRNKRNQLFNSFLTFCCIAITAIIGCYIRIGFGYYRIWKIETNYCLMYSQLIGCFIMGYVMKLKLHKYENSSNPIIKILFTAITSGLCGSITSFSGWQLQCNRNFFLQLDISWGNTIGSYNGGRLLEWIVCMWSGVVLPLSALHFGFYISTLIHQPNQLTPTYLPPPSSSNSSDDLKNYPYSKFILVTFFVITITLVVLLPVLFFPNWMYLSFTAVLGVIGAYIRYLLSDFNSLNPSFPIGTFIVNVLGTWIAAGILGISKFGIDYYDIKIQSILYGLLTGFCGCLTTVSTFVKEIDTLQTSDAYLYSFTTHSISQIGIILILNIYTYNSVPSTSVMPEPINMCSASWNLCDEFLNKIGCPKVDRTNIGCSHTNNYETNNYEDFQGTCSCGNFQTDRIISLLVDSQVKGNVTNSMVTVWPRNPSEIINPTEVYDFCLTYDNVCNHFLNRINCPIPLRKTNGCDKKGISNFIGVCECGKVKIASKRIKDILVDVSLSRRYDLLPYLGYSTLNYIDFDYAYESLCDKMMDHIQCPLKHRCGVGNQIRGNYTTWIGKCICNYDEACEYPKFTDDDEYEKENHFNRSDTINILDINESPPYHQNNNESYVHTYPPWYHSPPSPPPENSKIVDFSTRIAKNIFDSLLRPNFQSLLVQPNSQLPIWDMCASYYNICHFFLKKINCPPTLRYSQPCGKMKKLNTSQYYNEDGLYSYPHGYIQNVTSFCRCGHMNTLDSRSFELVITSLIQEKMNLDYLYLPPPVAPYSLAISSDPYRQLTQPGYTLPL